MIRYSLYEVDFRGDEVFIKSYSNYCEAYKELQKREKVDAIHLYDYKIEEWEDGE